MSIVVGHAKPRDSMLPTRSLNRSNGVDWHRASHFWHRLSSKLEFIEENIGRNFLGVSKKNENLERLYWLIFL